MTDINTVEMKADVNVEFEEASSRQQINSGESVKTLFGKLRKFLTDLKAVAFTGDYSDLSNKPNIDGELSDTSENPVQNKVIKTALDEKANISDIPTSLPANGGRSDDIKVARNVVRTSTYGLTCYHYETSDTSTYELPYGYVDLYRMMYASERGVELAINWNNTTRSIWFRGNHGGWSEWKKLVINGEMYVNANTLSPRDVDTIYDVGTYSTNGGSNQPNGYAYGSLLVLPYRKPYGNTKVDYGAQIFIANGDANNTRKMYYRTGKADSYNEWNELYASNNKPYVTGSVAASYSTESQDFTILSFTPSAVICKHPEKYANNGRIIWATPITNGFSVTINDTTATYVDYIAFK